MRDNEGVTVKKNIAVEEGNSVLGEITIASCSQGLAAPLSFMLSSELHWIL